jgi:hypothetical protein
MTARHIATKERRGASRDGGLGLREVDIAALLNTSDKTLRDRYPNEVKHGTRP